MDIVDFAWKIIEMDRTIREQESEIIRLQKIKSDYDELLDSSTKHSNKMMSNFLEVILKPGVSESVLKG